MHETRIFHDDTALPPPFAYPFDPVQTAYAFERDDDDVDARSGAETDSERKTKTSLTSPRGSANARLVAADVFAAIAAVAPARVVAADHAPRAPRWRWSPRARVRRAAATAARARLEPGPGGGRRRCRGGRDARCCRRARGDASGDRERGGFAHVEHGRIDLVHGSSCRNRRAAAAGALGAVFSGAAGPRDPRRFGCVRVAFDVQGAARGLADVMRGSDGDGAVAAAAALAAATRARGRGARRGGRGPALGALRVAAGGTSKERFEISFGDEENAGTETAAARARRGRSANLAAHVVGEDPASPTALSAWLEAVTRLCASRRPETRGGGGVSARVCDAGEVYFSKHDAAASSPPRRRDRGASIGHPRGSLDACRRCRMRVRARARACCRGDARRIGVRRRARPPRFGSSERRRVGVGAGGRQRGGPSPARSSGSWRVSPRPRRKPCARVPGTQTGYHADERRRGPGARR